MAVTVSLQQFSKEMLNNDNFIEVNHY